MSSKKKTTRRTPVTSKQVADYAGVSRAAVSRAFTPGASVSAETRRKVMEAVDKLGYQVNHLARGLNNAKSGLVALIAAEIETPYRAALLSALAQELQKAGKTPLLIVTDSSDDQVKGALAQASSYRTEAAIILSGMPDTALTDLCIQNGMRLVLINRDENREGTLQIRLDDYQAGMTAFHTLMRTGCERPALVASAAGTPSLSARINGFVDAAKEAGVAHLHVASGETSYATGLEIGTQLFSMKQPPDGAFCVTDLLACGVMDAARERFGLRVPNDFAIIGFDDIPQASWESYQLATFSQPIEDIAVTAAEWLSSTTDESEGQGETVLLPTRFIWRKTLRPTKQNDA